MATDTVAALVEMGFSEHIVGEALKATGSGDVQVAMDWILAHKVDDRATDGGGTVVGERPEESVQPKSLKCEDCGKMLRSELDAQAHAARTSHQKFSESTEEIKPLTPEEKTAQLAKLELKLKQKRITREEQEKKDVKEREKIRRKSGKELTEIKQKMELAEIKKLAEERKREKMEDRMARQKVRDQIAKDREAREACSKPHVPVMTPQPTDIKKDYTTCKLQIRLVGGTTKVQSFKATDTLQDVLTWLGTPTILMTTFPKRVFTNEDAEKTLKDLGLVPSAVLIQTS